MEKIHEKSPCCGVSVWRVWQKNKGPKKRRSSHELLLKYLRNEIGPLSKQRNKNKLTHSALYARMAKSLQSFNEKTPWPCVPGGKLVAIADAMIEYIEGIPHVIYFIFLRSVASNKAVIMPFFVTKWIGEGYEGWKGAFKQIPSQTRVRICALVCDGVMALLKLSREEGWVLQRCQFHLLARIEHCCSSGRFGKKTQRSRRLIKLARTVFSTRDETVLQKALQEIMDIRSTLSARLFRSVLLGFIKHHEDFRAYLNHPKYRLPGTSNSAEYMIGRIRNLQFRAHGFRTIESLSSWIEANSKFAKTITCNPKIHTPN